MKYMHKLMGEGENHPMCGCVFKMCAVVNYLVLNVAILRSCPNVRHSHVQYAWVYKQRYSVLFAHPLLPFLSVDLLYGFPFCEKTGRSQHGFALGT